MVKSAVDSLITIMLPAVAVVVLAVMLAPETRNLDLHTELGNELQRIPSRELRVDIIPLEPGPQALEVISAENPEQIAWANDLVTAASLRVQSESLAQIFPFSYQVCEPLVVPDEFFLFDRRQYDVDKLIRWLTSQRDESAFRTIAAIPAYIFADNRPWLSGRARLGSPVAILSSWRMGLRLSVGEQQLKRRWHILARHELGHTLGLHHVPDRSSLMFGGKTLEDLDAQSATLTEDDIQYLRRVCPVDWD